MVIRVILAFLMVRPKRHRRKLTRRRVVVKKGRRRITMAVVVYVSHRYTFRNMRDCLFLLLIIPFK